MNIDLDIRSTGLSRSATLADVLASSAWAASRPHIIDTPKMIEDWMRPIGGLRSQRILEYGCGSGFVAAGIALSYQPKSIFAMDVAMPDNLPALMADLRLEFPNNLMLHSANSPLDLPEGEFDIIYSFSVLQRYEPRDLGDIIRAIYRSTALGGRVLVQASQLYYSPDGAFLQGYGLPPWSHLQMARSSLRAALIACLGADSPQVSAALDRAENMPKIGGATLIHMFRDAGFNLVMHHERQASLEPPEALLGIYRRDALLQDHLMALFSKN